MSIVAGQGEEQSTILYMLATKPAWVAEQVAAFEKAKAEADTRLALVADLESIPKLKADAEATVEEAAQARAQAIADLEQARAQGRGIVERAQETAVDIESAAQVKAEEIKRAAGDELDKAKGLREEALGARDDIRRQENKLESQISASKQRERELTDAVARTTDERTALEATRERLRRAAEQISQLLA